jgi:putative acetyltransferase
MDSQYVIRAIKKEDNAQLANVIRSVLVKFNANHPGTVYYDESTDHLYEYFTEANHPYYVVEFNGEVVGGVGIFPTEGLPPQTCEMVKMYLLPSVRGKGIASLLIDKVKTAAKNQHYNHIYLESMPELSTALKMYEKKGWVYLCNPLGNSGHTGCDLWK